jgi:hypothetical protein
VVFIPERNLFFDAPQRSVADASLVFINTHATELCDEIEPTAFRCQLKVSADFVLCANQLLGRRNFG